MGFFLKKLVSAFLQPLPLASILIGVGLALLWFSRRQRAGKIVASSGFGLLLLFSYGAVADHLIGMLESGQEPLHPSGRLEAAVATAGARPRWVVVLGGGHTEDRRLPATGQLSEGSLQRLVEGVRLYRALPGAKLLVSGAPGRAVRHGEVLAAAARVLGVPSDDLVADVTAWDTHDEARALSARVGAEPFLLVTSASHMPRALRLFKAVGARPIPAPTDYIEFDEPGVSMYAFFPSASTLDNSARAVHEYLGFIWSALRGQL
jgi:uncharacterized SAM-binding protein YcdF (DUF218 family)